MSMHCLAFSQSQDEAGVLSYVAGVPDPSVRVSGNDIYVPDVVNRIIGGIALVGTTGLRARFISPSLRKIAPYEMQPLTRALLPGSLPVSYLHEGSPVPLDFNEALNAQIQADPAAAEQQTMAVFLSDKVPAKLDGLISKVRFTVTSILTAGQWVNAQIIFPDLLPVGRYKVVGSSLVIANGIVARWYPVGQTWRPGFIILNTQGDREDEKFRNGFLGEWFNFDQTQPPTIDLLGSVNTGSATYEGVMDVIPV